MFAIVKVDFSKTFLLFLSALNASLSFEKTIPVPVSSLNFIFSLITSSPIFTSLGQILTHLPHRRQEDIASETFEALSGNLSSLSVKTKRTLPLGLKNSFKLILYEGQTGRHLPQLTQFR